MKRIWDRYMSDIREWEEHARATNDDNLLALVQTFRTNRITALIMGCSMLIFASTALFIAVCAR